MGHLAVAARHHHVDTAPFQLLVQLPHHAHDADVLMGEAGHRIDHQALGTLGILHQQCQHPPFEVGGIEVGQRRVEAIDQDAGNGLGLLVVPQGAHHPFIVHAE